MLPICVFLHICLFLLLFKKKKLEKYTVDDLELRAI